MLDDLTTSYDLANTVPANASGDAHARALGRRCPPLSNLPDAQHLLTHDDDRARFCREVFQHSQDPLLLIEVASEGRLRLKDLNPAAERALGLPGCVLQKMDLEEIAAGGLGPDTGATMRQVIDHCRRCLSSGAPVDFEGRLNVASAVDRRDYEVRVIPIADAGRVSHLIAIGHDVTERRRHEEEVTRIREMEARLERFVANVPGFLYSFRVSRDGHASFPFASPGIAAISGLRPEDLRDDGAALHSQWHPDDALRIEASVAASARAMTPLHLEVRQQRPGHPVRWIELRSTPEREADGGVVWHGLMLDITERKRAEELLRQREAEFRTLAENIPDNLRVEARLTRLTEVVPGVLFTFRQAPGGTQSMPWASEKLLGIAGCSPEEVACDASALSRRIHAGDAEAWHQAAAESARTLLPWHSEFRLANPRRGEVWIEWLATPRHSADGGLLWHGFLHDISERKAAEASLRMAASVFDTALEGITITDPSGVILDVNAAFTRITGYSRDEVIGKNPSILRSGHHDRGFYAAMWAALRDSGTWSGEVVNRHQDGEVFTEHLSISAVRDRAGAVVHFVGIFSDISRSKQHEARLEHLAHHDTLTGLPNRVLLADRLEQAILQSQRSGKVLTVLFLDLDGFKPVNDTFGHAVGDRALIEMGRRMSKTLRASDTVARVGGDEFVMLLPGLSNTAECEGSVSRLLAAIAKPVEVDEHRLSLTASIGIARHPHDGDDADTLLRRADEAMYAAKQRGRNQFVLCGARRGTRLVG